MELLEIRLNPDSMSNPDKIKALRDTCNLAINAEKLGFKVERLEPIMGIPTKIIITSPNNQKTREDAINYAKNYLQWYQFPA